jgi:glucosyl-dolichyl phosphate glucuronosyltransferase
MQITVILCTYNRCQSLPKALESIAASQLPDSIGWEVLVIDNNSKDQTRGVIDDFCQRYPGRFRYMFEPKQGKSNALNTGIREARGSILAFMDDDVLVAPTWLLNLTKPLDSDEWAGAGGRILAQQAFVAPDWLSVDGQDTLGVLALFDLGDRGEELKSAPYGTNMAYRKMIFEKYGGFRTDMGPCPGSELRNEDSEFGHRVIAAGERLWYEPSAVVYHAVPADRLTKRYFLRFWYDHGRALVRERGPRPPVWGIPRWCLSIPHMLARPFRRRVLIWLQTKDPKLRFFYKGVVCTMLGQMVEMPRFWFSEMRQRRRASGNERKVRHSTTNLSSFE